MKLTYAQRDALIRIWRHNNDWFSTHSIKIRRITLNALYNKGYLDKELINNIAYFRLKPKEERIKKMNAR